MSDPAVRISQLWLKRAWSQDSLLVGIYGFDSEFMALESAGMFSNPAYGPTGDVSLTDTPSIFPTSAFGVRWWHEFDDSGGYWASAVLDGVAGDPNNPEANVVEFASDEGVFVITEMGFRELEGPDWLKLAAGGWWYSQPRPRLDADERGGPEETGRYGIYAQAEGNIWHSKDGTSSIDGFVRGSWNDGRSIEFDSVYSVGVLWHGVFAHRSEGDTLGISFSSGGTSEAWRRGMAAEGEVVARGESVLEILYRPELNIPFIVQPFFSM